MAHEPVLDFGQPRPDPEEPRRPQVVEDGARDEHLCREVRSRLEEHAMVDATRISVQVVNGEAFLLGTADNRFIRERAETLARDVEGITSVVNKVSIQPPTEEPGPILSTHEPGANKSGSTQRS